jgi:hypothetical protein
VADAVSVIESPVAAGTPPSWNSIEPLLLTFTVPGLGALARVTGIPPLFSRSYVTLWMTAPLGRLNAKPIVPVLPFEVFEMTDGLPPVFVLTPDGVPVGASLLEQLTRLVTPAHNAAAPATMKTAGFVFFASISRRLQMGALRQDAYRHLPGARLQPFLRELLRPNAFTEPRLAPGSSDFRNMNSDFRNMARAQPPARDA